MVTTTIASEEIPEHCPRCRAELILMPSHAWCDFCRAHVVQGSAQTLLTVVVYCDACAWSGPLGEALPGDHGEFRCPICYDQLDVKIAVT